RHATLHGSARDCLPRSEGKSYDWQIHIRAVLVFRECEPAVAIVAVTLDLIASGFAENALDLAGRNPIDLCHLRSGQAIPHPSSDGAKLRTRNFARRRRGNDRSFRLGVPN